MKTPKFKNKDLQDQYKDLLGLKVFKNSDDDFHFLDFGQDKVCVQSFNYEDKKDMEHDYKLFKSIKSDVVWIMVDKVKNYFSDGIVYQTGITSYPKKGKYPSCKIYV